MKIEHRAPWIAALVAPVLLLSGDVDASELGLVVGQGDEVDIVGVVVRTREWNTSSVLSRPWLAVSGEWQFSRWHAREPRVEVSTVTDGSFTAVLTFTPRSTRSFPPFRRSYIELGLGVHLISEQSIGADREFGSAFQFGEFLGTGIRFGSANRYSVAVRVQHVSNGRTSEPNDGITFVQGVVRCSF